MPINKEVARKDIPFLLPDLPKSQEILPYLEEIDRNRWYSNFGPLQQSFEQELHQVFFKTLNPTEERVVACSSGTTAIELALLSLNLRPNARVLLPSFTFAATATAVLRAGCCPVFTDVDPQNWLLTPDIAKSVLDYLTVDAVIPVAALGVPQNAKQWDEFTLKTGIPVVIDAAAALGEQKLGRHTTTCFSMHATKGFGIGEGGLVVTRNADNAHHIRRLSNFGFEDGEVVTAGSNYKLSEYHAAVGLAQIRRLDTLRIRRERVRAAYEQQIERLTPFFQMQAPNVDRWDGEPGVVSLKHHRFSAAVALKARDISSPHDLDKVIRTLNEDGIGVRRWYTPVLHHHKAFKDYSTINTVGKHDLDVTEALNQGLIGLPFHNFLSDAEVQFVCDSAIKSVTKNKRLSRKSRATKERV
ncbi:MAG: DegT/DnrJ/EryC1/StrS family aminotransferase [Pseudomonadales bacterium]|nr:DegT/DnrJ/EryC1/StrS family aminotransferase [Pseudomonadales bacterium]